MGLNFSDGVCWFNQDFFECQQEIFYVFFLGYFEGRLRNIGFLNGFCGVGVEIVVSIFLLVLLDIGRV